MAYTTTDLLSGVRCSEFLPDAFDLTDAQLLKFADEEQSRISAAIKTEREEHGVTTQDYALDGVTKAYPLPMRALGRGVRGIILVSPSGITYPCPYVDPVSGWYGSSPTATAYCHSIVGDQIVLPGPGPGGWTLRVSYRQRPSALVTVASAAAITKATDPTHVTLSTVPATFGSTLFYVDIVKGDAPFVLMYVDRQAKAITVPGDIELNPATPVVVADFVNRNTIANDRQDYMCLREQTVFPSAPVEFFPALEAAVCWRTLKAIGDRDGAALALVAYREQLQAAVDITSPREETGGRAIVRRGSPLRSGGGYGGRWRGLR